MIDDIRTTSSLATWVAGGARRTASPDGGTFDAALSAAQERQAPVTNPFLAPPAAGPRPGSGPGSAEASSRRGAESDAAPRSAADEAAPDDPQARGLPERQDAAARSERSAGSRRLAERTSEARADARRLADARTDGAAQAAARTARLADQAPGTDTSKAARDSGAAGEPADASASQEQASPTDPGRSVRDQSADNGNRVVAIPAGSSGEAPRQDPEAGAAAAQPAPGDPPAPGPAIASAATAAAAAAVATAAAAESAAASAAAATASASAALAASQAGLATSAADSALPASSGDALSTLAGRSAARQARSPGSDGGPAPQVAAGASDSGTFRLEIPGTTSGAAPDGATSSPSPRPQGSGAAGAAQAASLQRGAREAGASAITLDWRSQAARPEPGPAVAEPGGGRSQAAMLLDAIHESRGATTGTATGDTPANAAGSFAGALALAGAPAAGGTAAAPEPARLENPWPVHDPAFVEHLAGQVSEALVGGIERAEITLNPRDLGPIRIELSLSGESASVAFSATQPETRTAIEQSLPILRDMLLEHGLALAHTSVQGGSADASGGGQSQRGPSDRAPTGGPSSQTSGGSAVAEPGARSTRAARGLLDLFA